MERAYDEESIMAYQYSTLYDQLLLLQLHIENTHCPCSLREVRQNEIGEYCEPKHMRTILALARETLSMESDPDRIDYLKILIGEGDPVLEKMLDRLCGKDFVDEATVDDYRRWVRRKRKELEKFYYSSFCLIKPEKNKEEGRVTEKAPA